MPERGVSVDAVLVAIALTPSAPVLVPELAGSAAGEVAEFGNAAITAAIALPDRWVAVGVGRADHIIGPDTAGTFRIIGPDTAGTFAGYGVDVPVALSPDVPAPPGEPPGELPLCALFAGWLRGKANSAATVEVHVFDADLDCEAALARGRDLRKRIDSTAEPVGVLVVADGANTLTPAAPGGYDPGAESDQTRLDDALADADTAELTRLPPGVIGRVAYQVLAGIVGSDVVSARELIRGAPYGVGYFVGVWIPETR